MDNCHIHKAESLRILIESDGHIIKFLPPYRLQLSPIQEAFSQWKNSIKSMNCKIVGELNEVILNCSLNISKGNCNKYYEQVKIYLLKALQREEF
jgi:hypothetical protein